MSEDSERSQFERETGIVVVGDPGQRRWSSLISPEWSIGSTPNGGYTLATVLRAMRETAGKPDPLSVTCHYLRPASPGEPADIATETIRSGRTVSTVSGRLSQDGRDRLFAVAAMGDASEGGSGLDPAADGVDLVLPDLPPPQDCVDRSGDAQGVGLSLASRVEVKLHPEMAGGGKRAETLGWIRFIDRGPIDTLALVLFADAFPPAVFSRLGPVGWVPTIELTVHVRRRPAQGWVRGHLVTTDLQDGRLIEDGDYWDSSGALVARSRQLALLSRPSVVE